MCRYDESRPDRRLIEGVQYVVRRGLWQWCSAHPKSGCPEMWGVQKCVLACSPTRHKPRTAGLTPNACASLALRYRQDTPSPVAAAPPKVWVSRNVRFLAKRSPARPHRSRPHRPQPPIAPPGVSLATRGLRRTPAHRLRCDTHETRPGWSQPLKSRGVQKCVAHWFRHASWWRRLTVDVSSSTQLYFYHRA